MRVGTRERYQPRCQAYKQRAELSAAACMAQLPRHGRSMLAWPKRTISTMQAAPVTGYTLLTCGTVTRRMLVALAVARRLCQVSCSLWKSGTWRA
jgi:hypothetical protein